MISLIAAATLFALGSRHYVKPIAGVEVFILKDCPIADQYLPILGQYQSEYKTKGVEFQIIFEDSGLNSKAALAHLKKYGYYGPFALDGNHLLAKKFEATTSPEVFFNNSNGKILYHGRIDNRYLTIGSPRPNATQLDLKEAIISFLAHKPIIEPFAKPIGCLLQY